MHPATWRPVVEVGHRGLGKLSLHTKGKRQDVHT